MRLSSSNENNPIGKRKKCECSTIALPKCVIVIVSQLKHSISLNKLSTCILYCWDSTISSKKVRNLFLGKKRKWLPDAGNPVLLESLKNGFLLNPRRSELFGVKRIVFFPKTSFGLFCLKLNYENVVVAIWKKRLSQQYKILRKYVSKKCRKFSKFYFSKKQS